MAIFQPSNVIPSTFAGEGMYTVDATQPINISWQVNGNSPMTAFQIKIYDNTTSPLEELYDTGIIPIAGTPFYGIDTKGNPQQFNYSIEDSWTDWGISNGLECQMVITQWWGSDITASSTTQITQWSGSIFYTRQTPTLNVAPTTTYDEVCYQMIMNNPLLPSSAIDNGAYVDFSKISSISNSNKVYFSPISRGKKTYYFPINSNYLYAYSSSVSNTKTTIDRLDASFTPIDGAVDVTNYFDLSNVTQIPIYYTPQVSSSGTFLINNVDSSSLIKSVRWKTSAFNLYNPLRSVYELNLIEDTGVINTQQLSYENNIYQSNAFYQIECEVADQYGNTTVVDRFGNRVNSTGFIFMVYTPVAEEITSSYCNNKSDGSITVNIISSLSNISNIAFYEQEEIVNKFLYLGNYADLTSVKFYSFRSDNPINLLIYGLDSNNAYNNSGSLTCENYQLNSYYLYETTQDETYPNVYHVLSSWRFGNNISAGTLSNNNSPNWLSNFTPYRLRQPSSRLGESGTLQALLSNVNSSNRYIDTVKMMQSLKQASVSNNTFFLKDIKGNLYMVGISGPITQTINTKSQVQEVKISIPWEEIGDASNISLIQLPTDSGWGNNTEN